MGQPFGGRAAPDVDGVLGAGERLLHGKPTQHQAELWPLVTEVDIRVDRADLQLQVGQGNHGIVRLFHEAAGDSDYVARYEEIDDLPLAVAQEFVARGKAF